MVHLECLRHFSAASSRQANVALKPFLRKPFQPYYINKGNTKNHCNKYNKENGYSKGHKSDRYNNDPKGHGCIKDH